MGARKQTRFTSFARFARFTRKKFNNNYIFPYLYKNYKKNLLFHILYISVTTTEEGGASEGGGISEGGASEGTEPVANVKGATLTHPQSASTQQSQTTQQVPTCPS